MATKSLNFKEETIERFRELYPEYASGSMSAATLGEEILRAIELARTSQDGLVPSNEPANEQLRAEYDKLQAQYTKLYEQFNEQKTNYEDVVKTLSSRTSELKALKAEYADLVAKNEALVQSDQTGRVAELEAQVNELQGSLDSTRMEREEYEATSNAKYEKLYAKYEQLREASTREARGGNTGGNSPGTMPTNNEYINRVLDIVCQRVNKSSGTAYTLDDVVAQTLFKVMYERGKSITPFYPITRDELLHELQQYEPAIKTHEQMAAYMIHKIKTE